MTAADKLRELLATRPTGGSLDDLLRWWNSAALVTEVLDDLDKSKKATRAAWAAQHDALAKLHKAKFKLEHVADARDVACEMLLAADGLTATQYETAHRLLEIGKQIESEARAEGTAS